jgi:DNA-binding PadR family transcriptional regulator
MDLSQTEQFVMMAILRLSPNAYGVTMAEDIEKRAGRSISLGAIYAALERLEEKGFVAPRLGEATPERGGRRKTFYALTAPGEKALSASLQATNEMAKGLGLKGAWA